MVILRELTLQFLRDALYVFASSTIPALVPCNVFFQFNLDTIQNSHR